MPRRRALRLAGAAMLTTALPMLRPRRALAQDEFCVEGKHYCHPTGCCPNECACPPDPQYPQCVCPCPGGAERCGPSGICCTPDQLCEQSRGICCPRDPDAPRCNVPEPSCKEKADDRISAYIDSTCGAQGGMTNSAADMAESGMESMSCVFAAQNISLPFEYDRCPQQPSDARCKGVPCEPGVLRCKQPDCGPQSSGAATASSAQVHDPDAVAEAGAPRTQISARRVSKTTLRRRLRSSRPRVGGAYVALERELRQLPAEFALPRPALAQATASYRSEVVRLRGKLARGSGGTPQRLALAALDQTAVGLAAYRRAALAETTAAARREALRGQARFRNAKRAMRRARRALDCGTTC